VAGTESAAPLVMKLIKSEAVPTIESGLHPISMAIRKQAIRWS
jgi:hypothetical protein